MRDVAPCAGRIRRQHAFRHGMTDEWNPAEDISTAWSRRVVHETYYDDTSADFSGLKIEAVRPHGKPVRMVLHVEVHMGEVGVGPRRRGCLSVSILHRLRRRYCRSTESKAETKDFASADKPFLESKLRVCNDDSNAYTVHWSFYAMVRIATGTNVELFADGINESGIMNAFCSADAEDFLFGSIGSWFDMERSIVGGAGNPPFNRAFLRDVLRACDCGVAKKSVPYCRVLPLPQSVAMSQTQNGVRGVPIVTMPSGFIAFRAQTQRFDRTDPDPRPHRDQPFAIVVWVNESYFDVAASPYDIETVILGWIISSFGTKSGCVVQNDAVASVFPVDYRSHHWKGQHFGAA